MSKQTKAITVATTPTPAVDAAVAINLTDAREAARQQWEQDVYRVFDDAFSTRVKFCERLLALGVGDRKTARPLALAWAAARYQTPLVEGKRGLMLPRNSAADRACHRILDLCFLDPEAVPDIKTKAARKTPFELVLASIQKLSLSEQRQLRVILEKY